MSTTEENNNKKENFLKIKAPLYFSPYSHEKSSFGNLYTEPRNIHHEIDSNLSKNQIRQKINNANINKNLANMQQIDNLRKNTRLISEFAEKIKQNKKNPQSYKKVNSKLYLKKNFIPNISLFNDISGNIMPIQSITNSNIIINNNSPNDQNNKFSQNKQNKLSNIKFNIGKSNQNFLNSKNSSNNLKKNAGSACELLNTNNYLRKSKTKNKQLVDINNINQINYIYTSDNNQKSFLSPQNNASNPKILFLKKEKSNIFAQNISNNSKINQIQGNESNNNDEDNKNNHINYLMRNTFTNVKIYPTTILNNKIIYNQVEKSNQNQNNNKSIKNNKSESSNNNSKHYNTTKNKKEKIVIDTAEKSPNNNKIEKYQSIEELHYFYVDTLQKGKKYALKLDKCNS
jgi:hypothetical protein